jgi:hypothetical protein
MPDDPKIAALKAIVASSHGITGYATLAILAGIILELVILFIFAHEISRWEKAALVLANVLIAGGLAAEYWYGGKGADAAAELQRVSDENIAKANSDAATARLEQERLKRLVVWRSIPTNAITEITRRLSIRQDAITLMYLANDPEVFLFSSQISHAFSEAHWEVFVKSVSWGNWLPIGVHVYGDAGEVLDLARATLRAANVPFDEAPPPRVPDMAIEFEGRPTAVTILVGARIGPF